MPAGKNRSTVQADIKKNRLIFHIKGWITKKDLDRLYTDVRFCVADLKPGFHVITDLSDCTITSINGLSTFRKIMAFLIEKQPAQVVRITKRSSILHKQIMNLSARIQGYKARYVTSMEEAEQILAEEADSYGLRYALHRVSVSYTTEGDEETGMLIEISEQKCLVECISPSPKMEQKITLSFSLPSSDDNSEEFTLTGTVDEVGLDSFGVKLLNFADDDKVRLRACLTRNTQRAPLLDEPM